MSRRVVRLSDIMLAINIFDEYYYVRLQDKKQSQKGVIMGLTDYLEYISYKYHRRQHPEKEPSWWKVGFEQWEEFEELYQQELKQRS